LIAASTEGSAPADRPHSDGVRRYHRSQRIAWWLLKAARLGSTLRECERCSGPVSSTYAPNPRPGGGLELWTRCSICGWSVLQLCQPHGERVPFVPPLSWQAIENEIAAMRGESVPTQ
jgi:hypothetical protein